MVDSFAQHYHQRTKYDPETIASKSQGLDWSKQPSSSKEYKIGTVYDLKPIDRSRCPNSVVAKIIAVIIM
jgi:hypothetical protein